MMVNTLLQSVRISKKHWLISLVIAVLTTAIGTCTAVAGNPARLVSSAPTVNIAPTTGGIYLYGESDRPDIVGKEYIVFERIGNKAIGAFYLPRSEFSCFHGQFKGSRLNVTLIDTYDRQKYNFNLQLNPNGLTASKQPMMGEPAYQPLGKVSNNDQQILNTCKLQLQNYR
jgi:hypothetical protein